MITKIPIIGNTTLRSIDKANYYFVIVNLGISAFSFLRSFVFMHVLDLKELGVISLVQTIMMFMGLLQMGLLNGGFRIVSLGKEEELNRTNNTIYSYIALLLPLGVIFCLLSERYGWISELSLPLLLISVVFGLFTLLNNWYLNILVGEQKLTEVNISNVASNTLAILFLPVAYFYGFWGGMLVIMIQPLSFVFVSLLRNRELLPTQFYLNVKYVRYILSFGFIPFLGGIFLSVYTQVERWSITGVLGVEALGGFYLVFLYCSLYQLVPSSINSIFFPKGVKAYSEKRYDEFKRFLKYYYLVLLAYGILIAFVTIILLEPFVEVVFPKHVAGVYLVFLVLPGLILQSMSEPIGLILNSSVILKPMLVVNSSNLAFNVVSIILLVSLGYLSLENVAILRSASGCFMLLAYIIAYLVIKKNLYQ